MDSFETNFAKKKGMNNYPASKVCCLTFQLIRRKENAWYLVVEERKIK